MPPSPCSTLPAHLATLGTLAVELRSERATLLAGTGDAATVHRLVAATRAAHDRARTLLTTILPGEVHAQKARLRAIDERVTDNLLNLHKRTDGTLAGRVVVNHTWYPFHGDTLVTTIGGREVEGAEYIHTQPDGTLAGKVQVGGIWRLFHGDTLIITIGGREIENVEKIHTAPDGTLAGQVQVGGAMRLFRLPPGGIAELCETA